MSAVVEALEPRTQYLVATEPALMQAFDLLATAPGAAATLRRLILSLAVQGKLIQQDASDVSASDLLAQIRAEMKLQDDTTEPASPVTATPFDIPSSWEWASLGEVVDLIRGITFPASEKTKEPAPNRIACLRTTNVQHSIEWHDLLFVDRSFMGREVQLIRHHDIVMSMANSRELVGKVALIESVPFPEATFGGFLGVLRPRHIDPRYVMAVLRTDYARQSLIGSASQTTNIANISLAKLRPLPFPIPPLAEQQRIVARVEELMELCDALEQSGRLADGQHARLTSTLFDALAASESPHALAENWRRVGELFDLLLDRQEAIDAFEQTILELAVRGLLVPQYSFDQPANDLLASIRAEKEPPPYARRIKRELLSQVVGEKIQPFDLPTGWTWARFPEIGEFGRGKSKHRPRNDPSLFNPGIYPLIQTGEVSRAGKFITEVHSYYSEVGLAQSRLWPAGTLCITIAANIADSAILSFDACFPDSVVGFIPASGLEDARYLLIFMKTARQRLVDFAPATAQKNINLDVLNSVLIPLPPAAEQQRIVSRVEELQRLCADLRQRVTQARATQARLADALVAEVA